MSMVAKMKIEQDKQKIVVEGLLTHDVELKFGSMSDMLLFSSFPSSQRKLDSTNDQVASL